MAQTVKYPYEKLKKFCTDAFLKFGFTTTSYSSNGNRDIGAKKDFKQTDKFGI